MLLHMITSLSYKTQHHKFMFAPKQRLKFLIFQCIIISFQVELPESFNSHYQILGKKGATSVLYTVNFPDCISRPHIMNIFTSRNVRFPPSPPKNITMSNNQSELNFLIVSPSPLNSTQRTFLQVGTSYCQK